MTGGTRARRRVEIGLFVAPALLLYLLFVLLPIVLAGYYSFWHWSGLGPLTDFIGFDNYVRAFQDDVFRSAILHNGILVVLSLVVQLPLGLALALLLNGRIRGRAALRLVYFAPYVLSEVITAVIWLLMLQPDGLVDKAFKAAGLGGLVHLWLADTHLVLYTMFVVITWKYLGWAIILFLAGLQGIPDELLEAAAVDGASPWQRLRHVTLPLLRPSLQVALILRTILALQAFAVAQALTGRNFPLLVGETYEWFVNLQDPPVASAVALVVMGVSMFTAMVYLRTLRQPDTARAGR
jgi:raffinose/stachyose/melibiose transport system permease protein